VKKLFGRTDLEDALKRLDKLTHDDARTSIAQNLKATHAVDERVRGVAVGLAGVDDRVARVEDTVTSVNDRVVGIDDRVFRVDERVAGVDDRVAGVDDKVTAVADGKQKFSIIDTVFTNDLPRRKERKGNHPTNSQRCRPTQTFVNSNLISVNSGSSRDLSGDQLRDSIHKWLSPSDTHKS